MTPASILYRAKSEGVNVMLTPAGTIKATGNPEAVNRIVPLIRQHKAELIKALADDPVEQAAHAHGIDPERLRAELTENDIRATEDDLPGERAALWTFAGIVAKGILQEREEAFQERAAIREFDGGQSREHAEEAALQEVYCRDCAHWAPDNLNPDMGLGECAVRRAGSLPLPWPGATCWKGKQRDARP